MAGAEQIEERMCPICEQLMSDDVCPRDGVKTILRTSGQVRGPARTGLQPGAILAQSYRIESMLGRGAMGTVYAATQLSVDRKVALKVLSQDAVQDGTELQRFCREARSACALKHPNVVNVHDFGVDEETHLPYISMELVEGRTMESLIRKEAPLRFERIASLLGQVAKALAAAHERGIVHRDLKPENIMVSKLPGGDEHVTVLDFGIAKAMGQRTKIPPSITRSGTVVGTPRYMAPEQVTGKNVDARADLYALGCILHEMATGKPPFEADDAVAMMLQHVNQPPPPLPHGVGDERSPTLLRLHDALLDKSPTKRPRSAAVVARMLTMVARGEEPGAESTTDVPVTDSHSDLEVASSVPLPPPPQAAFPSAPRSGASPSPRFFHENGFVESATFARDSAGQTHASALSSSGMQRPRFDARSRKGFWTIVLVQAVIGTLVGVSVLMLAMRRDVTIETLKIEDGVLPPVVSGTGKATLSIKCREPRDIEILGIGRFNGVTERRVDLEPSDYDLVFSKDGKAIRVANVSLEEDQVFELACP